MVPNSGRTRRYVDRQVCVYAHGYNTRKYRTIKKKVKKKLGNAYYTILLYVYVIVLLLLYTYIVSSRTTKSYSTCNKTNCSELRET